MSLLWSLDEVARQLGGVSVRTVRRLVENGILPVCRVGRLVRIPSDFVREYVACMTQGMHNPSCAESGAWKGKKPWSTDETIPRSIGVVSPMQAARELDALLARPTAARPKRLKQSGSLKRIK